MRASESDLGMHLYIVPSIYNFNESTQRLTYNTAYNIQYKIRMRAFRYNGIHSVIEILILIFTTNCIFKETSIIIEKNYLKKLVYNIKLYS